MRKIAIAGLILFCAMSAVACGGGSSNSDTTTSSGANENEKSYPATAKTEFVQSCTEAAGQQLGEQAGTTCECIFKAIQTNISYREFQALSNQVNPQDLGNLPAPILEAVQKCVPGLAPPSTPTG